MFHTPKRKYKFQRAAKYLHCCNSTAPALSALLLTNRRHLEGYIWRKVQFDMVNKIHACKRDLPCRRSLFSSSRIYASLKCIYHRSGLQLHEQHAEKGLMPRFRSQKYSFLGPFCHGPAIREWDGCYGILGSFV